MAITRYLNPKNDVAFKKIFGTEKNKDVLMAFLNEVLGKSGEEKIKEVSFLNPVQQPDIVYRKESVVDVLCTDEVGIQYIVEMQVAKVGGFEKRAQYYASKAYCSQAQEGSNYSELKEVIFLAITDFVMFPNKKGYKSDHIILDRESREHDLKDLYFTFIELPKFKKENIKELETMEEKWCYFFKHAHEPDNIIRLIESSDEIIKRAYDALEAHNWTEVELRAYDASEKVAMDARARESYVRQEAREEALQEGMEKGMEKGIEKGRAEIAQRMLSEGLNIGLISKVTGLSEEEIGRLR
jgi:predicted transposase/invertase (TIGR01784 family)